jgi:DNA-binding transcriptional regulator YdaS (Cro superfamily)
MTQATAIQDVLKAAGGPAALARELRISTAAVSQWRRVPVDRVLKVEELTGLSRHQLRPDVYGPASEAAA